MSGTPTRLALVITYETLTALNKQQSHKLSNLAQANALVRIPAYTIIESGYRLAFLIMD